MLSSEGSDSGQYGGGSGELFSTNNQLGGQSPQKTNQPTKGIA